MYTYLKEKQITGQKGLKWKRLFLKGKRLYSGTFHLRPPLVPVTLVINDSRL